MLGRLGIIPVRHGHPVGRFVDKAIHGVQQSSEVSRLLGERRGPERPVQLGVILPAVEWQPECILLRLVEVHLLAQHGAGEQVQAKNAVPDDIVLLAPGSRFLERQGGVAAVVRFLYPLVGELLCQLSIFGRLRLLAAQLAELTEGAQAADRLGREVYVVREMAGEVVGAELVLRVKALGLEVLGPLLQHRPILLAKIGIALDLRQRGQQHQHVAGLLDRHLVLFGALTAAIDLAIGQRVSAEVVRRKRPPPARRSRVIHNRHEHGLRQRGTEQQELRRHRINHIHGADAAVRKVLLGEHERLAVGVGDHFVRRVTLAIRECANPRILLPAGFGERGHQVSVELLATLLQ